MKLTGTLVLILPDEMPERTTRGLRIPRSVKEKPVTGVVVDIGPLCETVRKADRVQFNRQHSSVIVIDEKEYSIGPESSIITFIYGE